MSTLFSKSETDNGYRLRYLEVFNWGTFNGKTYRMKTDGRTSLLTGANGSGKTTLIDALLTLLVPTSQRFYNQSSGAESKKERTEQSYFWGYYGKIFSEVEEKSNTEQLRNKADGTFSVLLACFQNSGTQHTITLVQVRWFANGGLQKVFIVAPYMLNINDHFGVGHFDLKGNWKRQLKQQFGKVETYDSFKEYSVKFSELFGLRDKALSLFNKTVGIKVLGNLTDFVREDMLEVVDAEEQFKELYEQYSNLLLSHNAIQKDEKQLELLTPIITNINVLNEAKQKKETFEFIENQMKFYLNKIEFVLLKNETQQLEVNIRYEEKNKQLLANSIQKLENEKVELTTQKAVLNIDAQISNYNKDIETETDKRNTKSNNAIQYVSLCKEINLYITLDEKIFKDNTIKIEQLIKTYSAEENKLDEEKFNVKSNQFKSKEKIDQYQQQINSYATRKNKIPDDLIAIREKLINLLEIKENELPFVGELIQVKTTEQQWEDAIEKLLHNFALQLIVPNKFIKPINKFIYTNNIQTKLVYIKIDDRPTNSINRINNDVNNLFNKINIKKGVYSQWIETILLDRYNYYCTNDLDVFYNSSKAITANGLIRNANRHEKDDRPNRWNKAKYTLGWDNMEVINYLMQQKNKEEKQYATFVQQISITVSALDKIKQKVKALNNLQHYQNFDELNWVNHAKKIEELQKKIQELLKSSDAYTAILKQLDELEIKLKKEKETNEALIKKIGTLEDNYNNKSKRILELNFDDLLPEGVTKIEHFLQNEKLEILGLKTLSKFNEVYIQIGIKLKNSKNEANTLLNGTEKKLVELIAVFVNPNEKILKEFPTWTGDLLNVSANLTAIPELEELYKTIQTQRLVENKRRFREYMDKSMLDALTSYKAWLNSEESRIKEMIDTLNVPLKKITFNKNPDTYLKLEYRTVRGENEINIFKQQLSAAVPSAYDFETQKDDNYREEVFRKIKNLITELQNEEARRKRVTDVRNWLTFSAREYTITENTPISYHDNTASYSGGQKAQFTYAILGAAIAYQFGIFQQGRQHKSLRFITVDEAFSKLDPEKSRFLMEFCEQLNLQLLIVTPLDKINIAEPYISAVHFVEIKNKRNSILHNLTMEEYYEKKESFKSS